MRIVLGITLHFGLVKLQLLLLDIILGKAFDNELFGCLLVLFHLFISVDERQTEVGDVHAVQPGFQNVESLALGQDH